VGLNRRISITLFGYQPPNFYCSFFYGAILLYNGRPAQRPPPLPDDSFSSSRCCQMRSARFVNIHTVSQQASPRDADRLSDLLVRSAYDGCFDQVPADCRQPDCAYSICVIGYWTLTSHSVTRLMSQNGRRDASTSSPHTTTHNALQSRWCS